MITVYKHFADFVKYIFTILLQTQHENNFLPTCEHQQTKVRRFLGIFFYVTASFIAQTSPSENVLKRDAILATVANIE